MSCPQIASRVSRRTTPTATIANRAICSVVLLTISTGVALADIDVNPAQPLTKRVTVQLIQTALNDGSSPATVFGNATERADIEAGIDTIWAQAGIDIAFLPTVNRYNNTFAYQGTAGTGTRPSGDLNTIFSTLSGTTGILNADSSVLNLILVNVVPAFAPLSEISSAGYARIRGNGIIGYVGDNLLGFGNGLDVIASVMAHEIGHNLGLDHTASGQPNLMSPNGTSEQLDTSQIDLARSSTFARTIAAGLTGDYNNNGVVDAADYAVWRKNQGTTRILPNDPIGGTIGPSQFNQWRTHIGQTAGIGTALPEPATLLLATLAAAIYLPRRGSPRRLGFSLTN